MKPLYFKTLSIFTIIFLGVLVYSNTFFSSFHFDDDLYIINDFAIRNIQNIFDIWKICPCRFITFLSIALNFHFNQLNVFGYHLFNITIHLGTAVLVWWLTILTFSTSAMKEERISQDANIIALFAGLIFVSHPIQIQAVTYIWQRAASLTALFYLASLIFYVKSRLLNNSSYFIFSLITAVMAMFVKENAITLPLMILLYEFCFLKGKKSLDWDKLFPFLMLLFIIPETMFLTGSARFQEIKTITGAHEGITPIHYLLTQFRVIVTYIRLSFMPFNQNLDYDYTLSRNFFEIPVLSSFLFLAAILYFAKHLFSKYRLLSFSIFWFFLTLLPESSILPQEDVIFEHRLYLPLVGFCIFLVSGAYYLFGKNNIKVLLMVLSLIVAFNSFLTFQRNKIWENEIVLWNDIVQKSPHKARAFNNLGWAYYNQGMYAQAMSNFNKAIAINPEYIFSYDDRGLVYFKEGNYAQAISEYDKAIRINPNYAFIFYNRANAFLGQKNYSQALLDYNKAIQLNSLYVDAYNARAKFYFQQSNNAKAILDYKKSIRIDPTQENINLERVQVL